MRIVSIVALSFSLLGICYSPCSAQASGRIAETCDLVVAQHYAVKGAQFMQSSDWADAVFALQAALDATAKCSAGSIDSAWGYTINVELAAAQYDLHNYDAALIVLSKAATWETTIRLSAESKEHKSAYAQAKVLANWVRSQIASAASRSSLPSVGYVNPPVSQQPQTYVPYGEVIATRASCDYFIVNSSRGYALLEWYGGWTPDRGDNIVGSFEAYGFHDVYDTTARQSIHIYVEDYWLSSSEAYDQLNDHCS